MIDIYYAIIYVLWVLISPILIISWLITYMKWAFKGEFNRWDHNFNQVIDFIGGMAFFVLLTKVLNSCALAELFKIISKWK